MTEIYCIISGKVQRVSYRAYIQNSATKLEIVGFVKNLPDDTVEIVAQGKPDILKEFVEYLHEGSLSAKIETMSVDWRTAKKIYDDFSILYERT